MRMNLNHVASSRFVLGRDVHCEFDYWPLAVSMPNKGIVVHRLQGSVIPGKRNTKTFTLVQFDC